MNWSKQFVQFGANLIESGIPGILNLQFDDPDAKWWEENKLKINSSIKDCMMHWEDKKTAEWIREIV